MNKGRIIDIEIGFQPLFLLAGMHTGVLSASSTKLPEKPSTLKLNTSGSVSKALAIIVVAAFAVYYLIKKIVQTRHYPARPVALTW